MKVLFRSYTGEADYMALRNLMIQKFADPHQRYYPSLGDLDYQRSFGGENFTGNLTVCEIEDGTIIGAIWPGHFRILYCFTGRDYVHLEEDIFIWAEKHYCGPSLEDRSGEEVYVWGYQEDSVRSAILKNRGYTEHTWYMYSGYIELDSAIPKPVYPKGFSTRPIQLDDLYQKISIMGGSAGLTEPDLEIYNRLKGSPTYQEKLDLVLVSDSNEVVGFANIWHDTNNLIAIIEPFGIAESHRRRGLATNLLYDCLQRLKQLNVDRLYINHGGLWTLDPDPDDAMHVYQRVGFQELGKMFVWCKPWLTCPF